MSKLQSNLSIADMLYGGHRVTANTFSWNRSNHSQTLIENPNIVHPFIAGNCYGGHSLLAPRENFIADLALYSGHAIFFMGK